MGEYLNAFGKWFGIKKIEINPPENCAKITIHDNMGLLVNVPLHTNSGSGTSRMNRWYWPFFVHPFCNKEMFSCPQEGLAIIVMHDVFM